MRETLASRYTIVYWKKARRATNLPAGTIIFPIVDGVNIKYRIETGIYRGYYFVASWSWILRNTKLVD